MLAKQVDGVDDGVEYSGMLVAGIEDIEGVCYVVEVRCEAVQQDGGAVEADDSDAVFDSAQHVVEHGAEVLVLIQVNGGVSTGLGDDHHREGLGAGVFFEAKLLDYAVVGEDEVIDLQGVDEFAGLGADERRNYHQVGAHGDGCRRGIGVGGSLDAGG